ncbi:hypothetical protein BB560_005398 [Smittium megazygosporum]|uniref:Nuclear pore protein n=1 Tax=Smittium megazygosporum TaxID=133381 RepID=A0A2T9Z6G6_9FUNG|nr:hypothetical protein BB560_005398 [Smittium megazygosporum]
MVSSLDQIYEQARKLAFQGTVSNIPIVERNLSSLNYESKKLAATENKALGPFETKLQTFFADGGIDTQELIDKSKSILLEPLFSKIDHQVSSDVQTYLNSIHEAYLIEGIQNFQNFTNEDFDKNIFFSLHQYWDTEKSSIYKEMGRLPGIASCLNTAEKPSTKTDSVSSNLLLGFKPDTQKPLFSVEKRILDSLPRVDEYLKVIQNLNKFRIDDIGMNLAGEFYQAANKTTALTGDKQISDCWKFLETITQGHDSFSLENERRPIIEPLTPTKLELINRSRRYLENSYLKVINKTIEENAVLAAVGGTPSINNTIRGYLQVKFKGLKTAPRSLELFDGEPLWAHMYYLLRCGKLEDLSSYAFMMENAISESDSNFVGYLMNYFDSPNHTLDSYNQERISASFGLMRVNANNIDPYKFALFKIIGRCDLSRKSIPGVVESSEDYLWHQLIMIREVDDSSYLSSGVSKYTLADFQTLLKGTGKKYFDPEGSSPLLYFQVLLISLQFEKALEYLLKFNVYFTDAVHFAITLGYYGLIRVVDVNSMTAGDNYIVYLEFQPQIDFNRLILDFSAAISNKSIINSIQYLFLLTLPKLFNQQDYSQDDINEQKYLCEEMITLKVYESSDYVTFLGDIHDGDTKNDGFLDIHSRLIDPENSAKVVTDITKTLAERSKEDGRFSDAIMLYNMAGSYNTALLLLSKHLGNQLFSFIRGRVAMKNQRAIVKNNKYMDKQTEELLGEIRESANIFFSLEEYFKSKANKESLVDQSKEAQCRVLLILSKFAENYITHEYEEALLCVLEAEIFPIKNLANSYFSNDILSKGEAKAATDDLLLASEMAEKLRDFDDSFLKCFPDILLATMDTVCIIHEGFKSSPYTANPGLNAASDSDSNYSISLKHNLSIFKDISRNLVVFAGMCQFCIPPDIFAQINKIGALLS